MLQTCTHCVPCQLLHVCACSTGMSFDLFIHCRHPLFCVPMLTLIVCTLMELAVDIYRNCACNISFCHCWYAKLSTMYVLRHSIRHLWRCWYYLNRLNKACRWHAVTECELEPTSYCSSMLTSSNRASLGEPLQTLSELVTSSDRVWRGSPKLAQFWRGQHRRAVAGMVHTDCMCAACFIQWAEFCLSHVAAVVHFNKFIGNNSSWPLPLP